MTPNLGIKLVMSGVVVLVIVWLFYAFILNNGEDKVTDWIAGLALGLALLAILVGAVLTVWEVIP